MNKKVGIKFKATGKVYDFDCGAFVLNRGDHVIVETEQGLGFGTVAVDPVLYQQKQSVVSWPSVNNWRKIKPICQTHWR
jgi:cell fate regulator YaaT (PSP1 superfamily)